MQFASELNLNFYFLSLKITTSLKISISNHVNKIYTQSASICLLAQFRSKIFIPSSNRHISFFCVTHIIISDCYWPQPIPTWAECVQCCGRWLVNIYVSLTEYNYTIDRRQRRHTIKPFRVTRQSDTARNYYVNVKDVVTPRRGSFVSFAYMYIQSVRTLLLYYMVCLALKSVGVSTRTKTHNWMIYNWGKPSKRKNRPLKRLSSARRRKPE